MSILGDTKHVEYKDIHNACVYIALKTRYMYIYKTCDKKECDMA